MIIKRINIIAFGGIKDKVIDLGEGLNIIYGENEAGKSTVQAFIKIWLYGFSSYRGKDYKYNERLKYTPLDGSQISGELYIKHENKEYIIKRKFGKTKKEDICTVIDGISGEGAEGINISEPGKSFLNINRATFINTLFIGQLAVNVKKDKEEEILDKISNLVTDGDNEVSIDKAFLKLENYKKNISNVRKNGKLDLLKDKYSKLLNERYESYKLSEHNLENEENLIKLNEEKENLNSELVNLEIYKKYLKKIKLKKEYEEISKYLKKKQELKDEEKNINDYLTFNDEIIDYRFLNDVKEEYSMYVNLLKVKENEKEELKQKEDELIEIKEPLKEYEYVENLEENIVSILERLKIKREVLKEKVNINKNIENEIEALKEKEIQVENLIRNANKIKEFKDEIEELLKEYEEKLILLKQILEDEKDTRSNNSNKFKICLFAMALISFLIGLIINNTILKFSAFSISIFSIILYFINFYLLKNNDNKKINKLKNNIKDIEDKLSDYVSKVGVNNYEELIRQLKYYEDYLKLKERINDKISEKQSQRKLLELDKALVEYKDNEIEIEKYLSIANTKDLDKLIYDIESYKRNSIKFVSLEVEVKNLKNTLEKTLNELNIKENKIVEKLKIIGLNNVDLFNLEENIKELEEKILLREEINKNLASVEEAYLVLTKDKDMNLIKEELKDVIDISFKYKYENEDEVDNVIKNKNLRLLNVEKEIKDVENEVNNRFNGKRTISVIEEEVQNTYGEINLLEKNLKASSLANEVLDKAYDEIRSGFGPALNEKVAQSFKDFTDNKYKDVKVSHKYEMIVLDEKEMIKDQLLSNGANDQLYLSLRLAFIEMIFKSKDTSIYLDDAFVQYDDKRLEKTIKYLVCQNFKQNIIFTCQKREINILRENSIHHKYIKLKR